MEIEPREYLLEVRGIRKSFPIPRGLIGMLKREPKKCVLAVDGVSFNMKPGEIVALVGESGSGKTTTALQILGLIEPSEGEIILEGENVFELIHSKRKKELRKKAQLIFQDPYESLNPRQSVFESVAEPIEVHKLAHSHSEKVSLVSAALNDAGLMPAEEFFFRYPQELSGGQRQRVVIAGGLILQPKMLIADEPVSMLDVSVRAEILNLLLKLRDEHNITILYITHDLATAAFLADRVAVMYLGVIVEIGPAEKVLGNPFHPYTKSLMSVIPVPNPRRRRQRMVLVGETPNPIDIPAGCRFHPRCPVAFNKCRTITPETYEPEIGHFVTCHLLDSDSQGNQKSVNTPFPGAIDQE